MITTITSHFPLTSSIEAPDETAAQKGPDFAQVRPGLFIGNRKSALDKTFIERERISHIVNCASNDVPSDIHPGVGYHTIALSDDGDSSLTPHLTEALLFINRARQEGGNVLVHCEEGISRAASIIIACLIAEEDMTYRQALYDLQAIRPNAQPNPTFVNDLKAFWLSHKMQLASASKPFSIKDCFPGASWLDWTSYRSIRDTEGADVGYTDAGRWGTCGAGVLVVSNETIPQFLLFERSDAVEEPGIWSIPGGAVKMRDGILAPSFPTAISELREEAGILPHGEICTQPIIFEEKDYSYHTYILILGHDKDYYVPKLNWESTAWKWYTKEEIENQSTVHRGVKYALNRLFHTTIDT